MNLQEAIALFKGFTSQQQRNIILNDDRKQALVLVLQAAQKSLDPSKDTTYGHIDVEDIVETVGGRILLHPSLAGNLYVNGRFVLRMNAVRCGYDLNGLVLTPNTSMDVLHQILEEKISSLWRRWSESAAANPKFLEVIQNLLADGHIYPFEAGIVAGLFTPTAGTEVGTAVPVAGASTEGVSFSTTGAGAPPATGG